MAALCLWLQIALAALLSASGTAGYDQCMASCTDSHSACQARCRRYLVPRRQEKRQRDRLVCRAGADRDADGRDSDGEVVLGDDMTAKRR